MKLLAEPVDLSSFDGLYIDVQPSAVGADPSTRAWKVAVRTKQDRSEVVYQTQFTPPAVGKRDVVFLPFKDFRLVRGPRLVPQPPQPRPSSSSLPPQPAPLQEGDVAPEVLALLTSAVENPRDESLRVQNVDMRRKTHCCARTAARRARSTPRR